MSEIWRRFELSFIVVLATLLSPAGSTSHAVDPSSARFILIPGPGASADQRLRSAILSIHAYVEQYRTDAPLAALLANVEPMQPAEAAAVINSDKSPLADLYRRRALLRLLVWVPDRPGVRKAVEILAGPKQAASIYDA